MAWNKINTMKSWTKVDVDVRSQTRTTEPLASLCKCNGRYSKIYLNNAAVGLASELGLENKLLDAYRSGAEFAFAKGERFTISLSNREIGGTGYIAGTALCDRIWTATKCSRFHVSIQEGEYLVLTPAYDMEKEGQTNGKDD